MGFYRIYPTKDTSIANADPAVGTKDISYSNVGASEILNLYKCAENSASAMPLLAFSIAGLSPPPSATVTLKLFDAQHSETLPYGYDVWVRPIEQDWVEGVGHDMDLYTDLGPANDLSATLTSSWAAHTGVLGVSYYFANGHEDLVVDVTNLLSSSLLGFSVSITQSVTGTDALYIKKFHSRQSHFPTKRPYLEIKWSDWTGSLSTTPMFYVTASGPWSGSYTPKWNTASLGGVVVNVTNSLVDPTGTMMHALAALKPVYDPSEEVRLYLYSLPFNWDPVVITSASSDAYGTVLTNVSYRVVDAVTDEVLVPFDSSTLSGTRLSYDDRGNYFDFYMSSMPTGTLLRFDFEYHISGSKTFVPGNDFTFRVV